jgi:nucleotide-binding universal stress UspA family protein
MEVEIMNKSPKILVHLDFSEESANGLKYAFSLAQGMEAELIVLYVTERKEADDFMSILAAMEGWPAPRGASGIPIDRLVREKTLDIYNFVQEHVRNPHSVTIKRRVVVGKKNKKILEVAKQENVDFSRADFSPNVFFALSNYARQIAERDLELPVPGAFEAATGPVLGLKFPDLVGTIALNRPSAHQVYLSPENS